MSRTINEVVKEFVIEFGGGQAKSLLAVESGLSVHLIEKVRNTAYTPKPENVRKLEKAIERLRAREPQLA
jgi:hypothetical protein